MFYNLNFSLGVYIKKMLRLKGGSQVHQEDVFEISGVIPDRFIDNLLDVCQMNSFERLQTQVDEFMCEGNAFNS